MMFTLPLTYARSGRHIGHSQSRIYTRLFNPTESPLRRVTARSWGNVSIPGSLSRDTPSTRHGMTYNWRTSPDTASLAEDLNLKSVRLINDLEAVARAVPILRPSDVQTLNTGQPVPKGAIGVVAPGTGLGESFLTWDESKYVAYGSEGGHADFATTDERQIGLLR